jgi:hypothetical protein
MTKFDFINEVDEVLIKYKIKKIFDTFPNDYWLNDTIWIRFYYKSFRLWDKSSLQNIMLYESPTYDSYEKTLDELIIFKELVLPKYL